MTSKKYKQINSKINEINYNSEPTVEEIYKQKTLHQHILSAPDTYIGSASCSSEEMWVLDKKEEKIVLKDITFPPGLYKINDELYVNARDHSVRDPTCKTIKITINQDEDTITVLNDGNGVPVEIHKGVNVYVPEMIFGRLLTSSNYEVKGKTVGGKNGYGAKLANIYSEEFIVETVDKKRKKKYVQKFSNNMYTVNPPEIKDISGKIEPYTKITFKPDLKRFGIGKLTDDIVSLLEKRVYDLAACTHNGVNVYLNDKLIKINSFEDYIKLYYDKLPSELVYQEFNERWKVGMLFDPNNGFRQISFVNGICTYQGGIHVNHVLDQLSKELITYIKEKNKNTSIKGSYIKENITLFIDSIIEDPSFKSQTKEELTTKISEFGSKCEMTSDFIKRVMKTGIVEEVVRLAEFKHQGELAKTDYKKTNNVKSIEKLDDAHWAGTRKSKLCRLILTEGDSAKAFAVSGLDIVGRERFGVFPLRGKFLNVREATVKQLLNNEEFKNLKQILGLKQSRKYNDLSKLRYGGVIILTDQDSVASDTPLLLRKNGKIYIQTIETISPDFYNNEHLLSDEDIKNIGNDNDINNDNDLIEDELIGDDLIEDDLIEDDHINENNDLNNVQKEKNDGNQSKVNQSITIGTQKEYGFTDFEVWTDNGWTKIKKVMRHKVTKQMYRILTHSGVVDVTEDHSLLNKNGNKISPKECKVDMELLHSFPRFEENNKTIPNDLNNLTVRDLWEYASENKIQYYQYISKENLINKLSEIRDEILYKLDSSCNITEDEAYVMGLFFCDGACGVYKWVHNYKQKDRQGVYKKKNRTSYSWAISNTNISYLEKAKNIMSKIYEYDFKIIEDRHNEDAGTGKLTYKLIINGGAKTLSIVRKYRNLFYDKDKGKCIPPEILNANRYIRQNFLNGYYDGDGTKSYPDKKKRTETFDVDGKIGAFGLYFLSKSLGYQVSINHQIKKSKIYTLTITEGFQQDNPFRIKKIIKLGYMEQYVYDLETENHHFHAGVGSMVVHNTDGSHIKGLIINMFATFWPSLLKLDGYVQCMSTPIIKVFKKSDTKKQKPICFYTITSYKNWIENNLKGDTSKYTIKYYKGLGTSTEKEAKEVFNDFENRLVKYVWETADGEYQDKANLITNNDENEDNENEEVDNDGDSSVVDGDGETDDGDINDLNSKSHERISLAFEKSKANERKNWLFHYDKNNILDIDSKEIFYSDFIDKELIHFSAYSNQRSIPSIIDGFKPSHRKILFGCIKRKIENEEVKVAQLGAYIAEHTLYHHGEDSLYKTIIKMAQTFVGSNNINLLQPLGNFGNRRQGGKDSASSRYIFTQLNKLTPLIFKKDDECVYSYIDEDGTSAEPERYAPIIPFVLVNGAEGIGTGFSTFVPPYNPHDIAKNIKLLLNDDDPEEMIPWFRGFKGEVKVLNDGKVQTTGIFEIIDDKTIKITELPIEFWTEDYKEFLDNVQVDSKSTSKYKFVESYINNSGNNTIEFIITFVGNEMQQLIKSNTLEKHLKLTSTISLNNMYLHNSKGTIAKYVTAEDILIEFYKYRLNLYSKRKQYVLKLYENDLKILEAKVRFIEYVLSKKIKIGKRDEEDIIQDLRANGFEELSYNIESENPSFRYLTDMKLFSLTNNKMKELIQERDKKRNEYGIYGKMTIKQLWNKELDELMIEYGKWLSALDEDVNDTNNIKKNKGKKNKGKLKGTVIKVKGKGNGKGKKLSANV